MFRKQLPIRVAVALVLAAAPGALGVAPIQAEPIPKEVAPRLAGAKPAPGARGGLWSRATTLARFRGRWLDGPRYERFRATQNPDEVLRFFPGPSAVALTSVALETGFEVFLRAKRRPGEAIAIPEKHLEVIFHVQRQQVGGKVVHQPIFTLRATRIVAPAPGPGAGPPPPP